MKFQINSVFKKEQSTIVDLIKNFESLVDCVKSGDRNKIKNVSLGNTTLCIKAFKKPNLFNKIAYTFFRKSKAQRSFEHANRLLSLGINTPTPIAFFEFKTNGFLDQSFYISEQLDCELTYRDLNTNLDYPEHENILRAFTRFTHNLHQNNVLFLDHSPGNTLILKRGNNYQFFLVDLNRMRFGNLSFRSRIYNFKRLSVHPSVVAVMSDELSKLYGSDYNEIYKIMWTATQDFQSHYKRKKRLKKKIKFWIK